MIGLWLVFSWLIKTTLGFQFADKIHELLPWHWWGAREPILPDEPKQQMLAPSPMADRFSEFLAKQLTDSNLVSLEIDSGWQSFKFGNVSTEAIPEWIFELAADAYVWITDSYCRGDSFYIYNNDVLIATTADTIDDGCKTNATNPDDAVQDGTFGHVYFNFTPGSYRIKMTVKDSPFLAGKGFIRLDSEFKTPGAKPPTSTTTTTTITGTDNGATSTTSSTTTTATTTDTSSSDSNDQEWTSSDSLTELMTPELSFFNKYRCKISVDGLHLFKKSLRLENAHFFCEHFGMRLAIIDNSNLVDALKLSWDCTEGAEGERLWIGEYTGTVRTPRFRPRNRPWWQRGQPQDAGIDYQLRIGQARGRGSIVKSREQSEALPFICMQHPVKNMIHMEL